MSTLEKRAKQEAERYQNTKNCIIESVQKQENIFHTIELDEPDSKESSSPNTMKAMLVKGIQNLKEKLHNTLHQDEEKGGSANASRCSTLDKRSDSKLKDEGFKSVELNVPEDNDKTRVVQLSSGIITEEVEKKRKGKAPVPPQEDNSIPVITPVLGPESIECVDSDNETVQGGKIELDSSHVTVHQAEGEGRKASSLGDLSRYEADRLTVLERAVSLDLADGSGGRKRKAPQPPQELTPYKEVEPPPTGTLKKSNVWGTLEDAFRGSDTEGETVESGRSTPDGDRINSGNAVNASSTPDMSASVTNISVEASIVPCVESDVDGMSVTTFDVVQNSNLPDPRTVETTSLDWQPSVSHNGNPTVNGNSSSGGSTPPLPTSPIPDFITEIEILSDQLIESDSSPTMDSFQTSFSTCRELNSPELSSYKPITFDSSSKPVLNGSSSRITEVNETINDSVSLKRVLDSFDEPSEIMSYSSTSVSDVSDSPKRMKTFGASLDDLESPKKIMTAFRNDSSSVKKSLDFSLDESFRIKDNLRENNKPAPTFGTFKVESKHKDSGESSLASKLLRNDIPEKKFSLVEIETDSSTPPSAPAEISKPPRNVSITSIKTNTSRIPVRAGQRSPGSGKHSPELRRVSDHRNGHHSP